MPKYKTPERIQQSLKPDTAVFAKLLSGKKDLSFDLQDLKNFCLTDSGFYTDNFKVQRWN